jgi:RNA polymerase sigma-70 factor (ECF subfamily)
MLLEIKRDGNEEKALVRRAARGDLDAFNQLVLGYQSLAYHYAYTIVQDADFADDITQESFIKAFTSIHRLRGDSFRAWLLKIVTNTAYDLLRRFNRHPTRPLFSDNPQGDESETWLMDPAASLETTIEMDELSERLVQTLCELPEIYRNVITLVDVYEMSYTEVSEVLRVPLGTVKSRLARARMQMRMKLQNNSFKDQNPVRGKVGLTVQA